ncbi:MAG: hypothetical protein IT410_00425 [Candidatus Doudnabacteria bacterium]|nr:hypothetical protein [Candidatus Doudnabacteria bacterium]
MITSPQIKTFVPKMTPERGHFTEIALLAIIIILFSWFVLKPRVIVLTTLRNEQKAIEEQQASVADQKNQLLELVSKLESSSIDVAVLDEALPLNSRLTTMAVLTDSLAKSNGMSVASIAVDGSESSKAIVAGDKTALSDPYKAQRKLNTATVLITTSGTLEQFVGFLNAIENSTRVMDVQTIDISGQEQGQLLFKVKVRGYSFST